MMIEGCQIIAGEESREGDATFSTTDPATGEALEPAFAEATADEVDLALRAAGSAARRLRRVEGTRLGELLDAVAGGLEEAGDALVDRVAVETGLPRGRIEMERGRTTGQLRLFADVARSRDDDRELHVAGDPDRTPLPRPDLRRRTIPVGPVAVFGASNFPLAFSVAGGDTAAAIAAGCPVVAKGHPAHAGTCEIVGRVIARAVRSLDLPAGTFSLLQGSGNEVGMALVRHPLARAVAFTGSRRGGLALFQASNARPEPIPVFAEMSSVNPTFLLPGALAERGEAIAEGLVASVGLGAGQFCTNPGLVIACDGPAVDSLVRDLASRAAACAPQTMLHRGIRESFAAGVARLAACDGVTVHGSIGDAGAGSCDTRTLVAETTAAAFIGDTDLREEVFGPITLVVRCPALDAMLHIAETLPGQLTATVHAAEAEYEVARRLFEILEEKAGRLLLDGFSTGVEVSPAMTHGGPWPATTDARFTSVGTAAIDRFLRPLTYQGFPDGLA